MSRRAGIVTAILSLGLMAASPVATNRWHYRSDPEGSAVSARVAFLGLASKTAKFPQISGELSLPATIGSESRPITLDVALDARALQAPDALTLKRLKGPDFFDVDRFATIRFTGERLRMTGPRTADVTGSLTARGVTRPETLHVSFDSQPDPRDRQPIGLTGTMRIDRRAYGMHAWSLIVGRKVDITIRTRMVPR